ncbi:MAG: helix-turn-helix domain-containing protein [Clostridia bacterium]|nr:helix-turn-helix domain-containing protein [Clostridia bacterium]
MWYASAEVYWLDELKTIIAANIASLRKAREMTQFELAERLNYSDKAVSKWERGESIPDVAVLKQIADLFSVTVDYLLTDDHSDKREQPGIISQRNRMYIMGLSILLVWFIATLVFVVMDLTPLNASGHWLTFIYALPVSAVVWLVFNSIWFSGKINWVIISLLMWSFLLCLYLTLTVFGSNLWLIFILGIPGQAIIYLWSGIRFKKRVPKKKKKD